MHKKKKSKDTIKRNQQLGRTFNYLVRRYGIRSMELAAFVELNRAALKKLYGTYTK